jgi:hypothetical protein
MYGKGAETAVQLLNKALGDPEAPVGEDTDPNKPKKEKGLQGFDPATMKALAQLKANFPNAPDELSALLAKVTQTSKNVKKTSLLSKNADKTHDERIEKLEKDIAFLLQAIKKVKKENVNEFDIFKSKDSNNSVKEQDPNKLKVLDWIADRTDGKEHFLSFYRKGAAWSGKLIFIKPDQAKRFMQKVEANPDYKPQIKQALTNIASAGKLFDKLGVKYQIRNAD